MKQRPISSFRQLLSHVRALPAKRVLIVYPSNAETFQSIAEARHQLHVEFILVGDREVIEHGLESQKIPAAGIRTVHAHDPSIAVRRGVELTRDGQADILMKGSVDTGAMMRAVLQEESNLRTGRLLSDIFLLEFPRRPERPFIMITDGGMNLSPSLKDKVELVTNAVEVAHALGNAKPRVAILSATEFVLPNLQSTVDAAALAKMNERGQIKGCVVDGPLALDNAISNEAVREKRIKSPVAGRSDILVAANIESANSLAKSTTYFAALRLAHVIMGARVPILIPSRADKSDARLLSIALGIMVCQKQTKRNGGPSGRAPVRSR